MKPWKLYQCKACFLGRMKSYKMAIQLTIQMRNESSEKNQRITGLVRFKRQDRSKQSKAMFYLYSHESLKAAICFTEISKEGEKKVRALIKLISSLEWELGPRCCSENLYSSFWYKPWDRGTWELGLFWKATSVMGPISELPISPLWLRGCPRRTSRDF